MLIFHSNLECPNGFGSSILAILCYITFAGNIHRIIKANTILIPILILSIIILSIKSGFGNSLQNSTIDIIPSIGSAILYASYNSIILIPILLSLQKELTSEIQIKVVTIICIIILAVLAICILNIIWKIDIDIRKIRITNCLCCK